MRKKNLLRWRNFFFYSVKVEKFFFFIVKLEKENKEINLFGYEVKKIIF